jgi:hypothetical protein
MANDVGIEDTDGDKENGRGEGRVSYTKYAPKMIH